MFFLFSNLGLVQDIVNCPLSIDKIFDFFNTLADKFWYETSLRGLSFIFDLIFIPWLNGYFFMDLDDDLEEDFENLLWLITGTKVNKNEMFLIIFFFFSNRK